MNVVCECGQRYQIKDGKKQGKFRCRTCKAVVQFGTKKTHSSPVASELHRPKPHQHVKRSKADDDTLRPLKLGRSLLLGFAWIPLAIVIAGLAPCFGFFPEFVSAPCSVAPLLVTALLIMQGLFLSLGLYRRTGQAIVVLPLALMQLLLFTTLFYQISCHLGAEYYAWDTLPGTRDWFEFSLAHAFRAGDVIDTFEAFGRRVHVIRSSSHLVAATVIVYHLVVDIFILELLAGWFEKTRKFLLKKETFRIRLRKVWFWFVCIVIVSLIADALFLQRWETSDLLLWPVENFLAVIDITDVMSIYEIHLHRVPANLWAPFLAISFRIIVAILVADALGKISKFITARWFPKLALSFSSLLELTQHHPDPAIRTWATSRIATIIRHSKTQRWSKAIRLCCEFAFRRSVLIAGAISLIVLSIVAWKTPSWETAATKLSSIPSTGSESETESALKSLRKMGSFAEHTIPGLLNVIPRVKDPRQQCQVIETIACLGPSAGEALSKLLSSQVDIEVKRFAVQSMVNSGPASAPSLILAFQSNDKVIRETAEKGLRSFGNAAIQPIVESVNSVNAHQLLPILVDLDPYWNRRPSPGIAFDNVAESYRLIQLLEKANTGQEVSDAFLQFGNLGNYRVTAIPILAKLSTHSDPQIRAAARASLPRVSRQWYEFDNLESHVSWFAERLTDDLPNTRIAASEILSKMGPAASPALPQLIARINDHNESPEVLEFVIKSFQAMGPLAVDAVPSMSQRLDDLDTDLRGEIVFAFREIGGEETWHQLLILAGNDDDDANAWAFNVLREINDFRLDRILFLQLAKSTGTHFEFTSRLIGSRSRLNPVDLNTLTLEVAASLKGKLASKNKSVVLETIKKLNITGRSSGFVHPVLVRLVDPDRQIRIATSHLVDHWRKTAPDGEHWWIRECENEWSFVFDAYLSARDKERVWDIEAAMRSMGENNRWYLHPKITNRLSEILGIVSEPTQPQELRFRLINIVGEMGLDGLASVPTLADQVKSSDLRSEAAKALTRLTVPPNWEAHVDLEQQELLRNKVIETSALLAKDEDVGTATLGRKILLELKSEKLVPVWIELLKSSDSQAQTDAIKGLYDLGDICFKHPDSKELRKLLFTHFEIQRSLDLIVKIAEFTEADLATVVEILQKAPENRVVWQMLVQLGVNSLEAIPEIANVYIELKRLNPLLYKHHHKHIESAMRSMGSGAVEPLSKLLNAEDEVVQEGALDLILMTGSNSAPEFIKLLSGSKIKTSKGRIRVYKKFIEFRKRSAPYLSDLENLLEQTADETERSYMRSVVTEIQKLSK